MHPVITLLGVHVHAYALCTWVAAITACVIAQPGLKRSGWTIVQRIILLVTMCCCFLIGARLWNVIVNPDNFKTVPWYTLRLVGLSLYGGLFGAVCALLVCCRVVGKSYANTLDAMVLPGGIAFCISRFGCFLNGCCGGIATNSVFGMVFPSNSTGENVPNILSFLQNRAVHPTQLYELIGAAIGLVLVVVLSQKWRRTGVRFFSYVVVFSAMRWMVLPLRLLSYSMLVKTVAYPVIYGCMIGIGVVGLVICMLQQRRKTKVVME